MIGKPTHGERPRSLSGEQNRSAGNYRIFLRWRPLKFIIVAAVVLIGLLGVISGLIQKELWMRQLGYTGVFWTLLSLRWGLFCAAFAVALLYLWINLRLAAGNGAAFRVGSLTSESTFAAKIGIEISPSGFEAGHGRARRRRRSNLCGHLLCTMGYVSPFSLWRTLWVVRSSLRSRCRVLSFPSPLL